MGSIPTEKVLLLKAKYGLRFLVETGTYKGATALWAAQHFEHVYTVEGNRARFEKNLAALKDVPPNVDWWYGDSRVELARMLRRFDAPCLLWLDAHMCNESYDPREVGGECPILEEINAVNASTYAAQHVILIDDARYFIGVPPYPHNPADWARFPQIEALLAPRKVSVVDDVIYGEPL